MKAHTIWIIAHLAITVGIILTTRWRRLLSSIAAGCAIYSLIIKPITYDSIYYVEYLSVLDDRFETGFRAVAIAASLIADGNPLISLVIIQILLLATIIHLNVLIYKSEALRGTKLAIEVVSPVINSLFFFLSSQNVLRQGLSVSVLGYATYFLIKGKRMSALLAFAIATSIHRSAPITALALLILVLIRNYTKETVSIALLLIGLIFIISLRRFEPTSEYLISDFSWGSERTSARVKLFVIGATVALSHWLIATSECYSQTKVRMIEKIRVGLFFFAAASALFNLNDLYSRILFPLFLIETILICRVFAEPSTVKYRAACSLLMLSYGFAPNVANIFNI